MNSVGCSTGMLELKNNMGFKEEYPKLWGSSLLFQAGMGMKI